MIPWDAVLAAVGVVLLAAWPAYQLARVVQQRAARFWAHLAARRETRRFMKGLDLDYALVQLCVEYGCQHDEPADDLMQLADEVDDGRGDLTRWFRP